MEQPLVDWLFVLQVVTAAVGFVLAMAYIGD